MANGQQIAQIHIEAFHAWSASMSDEDFCQITYRGKLNRGEVAKGIGCAKSALRQNPKIKELLAALEDELRNRGVLPSVSDNFKSTDDTVKIYNQTVTKNEIESKRINKLEQENIALKAKCEILEKKLSKYSELNEVLGDLGRMPQ